MLLDLLQNNPVGVKMSSGHHTVLSQPCALGKVNVTVPKAAHEVRSKALDDQSRFCHFSAHSQDAPCLPCGCCQMAFDEHLPLLLCSLFNNVAQKELEKIIMMLCWV